MASNNGNEQRKVARHLESLQAKARTHTVRQVMGNLYEVTSGGSGNVYNVTVTPSGMFCRCEYAIKKGTDPETGEVFPVACSHTIAVFEFIALGNRRLTTLQPSIEAAQRQKRPVVDTGDGVVLVTRKGHYKQASFLDKLED